MGLKYTIERILKMDYKNMLAAVSEIHQKSGKSRAWLFRDMVNCGFRYGAGYKDYLLWDFQDLTPEQRATYVTRGVNNRIVQRLNDPAYYHVFENKTEFNQVFSQFVHRDWLNMEEADFEAFSAFMENHEVVISKPASATCGKGIEKLRKDGFSDLRRMYDHLKETGSGLIEECILQHPEVAAIYPDAVNTYRIVTVAAEGKVHILYSCIRIGNGGKFVDNINSGGMTAPVDIDTGVIRCGAIDKDNLHYDVHPATGCQIAGYQLPYWRESVQMCADAAKLVPQIGYVGWDVAVSESGPQLIEGNHIPGHDIIQMPPNADGTGMLPRFREILPGL